MGLHRAKSKIWKKVTTVVATLSMVVGVSYFGAAAFAATGVGHHAGHTWDGDGTSFIGSYAFDDSTFGYCMDAAYGPPTFFSYTNQVVTSFQREDGIWLDSNDMGRLAYLMSTYGDTANDIQASAMALNVWRITGMDGHDDSWYAARANGNAAAVIALADDMMADANANATTGVTATVNIVYDDPTGQTATIWSDIEVDYISGASDQIADGSHVGTLTITGGVFESTGTNTASITNGEELTIIPDRRGATIQVNGSVSYSNLPYGTALVVGFPDGNPPSRQRVLFGAGSNAVAVTGTGSSVAMASDTAFQIQTATQTSLDEAEVGDMVEDEIVVTVEATTENPDAEWGVYDDGNGNLEPIPVTIRSTFWRDNSGGPITQQPTVPADADNVCEVQITVTAPGTYTTPPCEIEVTGYHVWTERIDPNDTPVLEGGNKVLPWSSEYGIATEITFVPFPPVITSNTTHPTARPNTCISDVLHVTNSNTATTEEYVITSTLLGPFNTKPTPDTVLPDLADQPIVGTVETTITGNGDFTTPCINVASAGWYVWVLESEGTVATDGIIPAFTDYMLYDTEMSLITLASLANTGMNSEDAKGSLFLGVMFFGSGLFLLALNYIRPRRTVEVL